MKTLLAAFMLMFSASASAVLPQAVTVVLHGLGGYFIAMVMDKAGAPTEAGIAVPSAIGFAKELSDVNFNGPDFVAWPIGAALYHLGKQHPDWCWQMPHMVEEYPHIYQPQVCPK